MATNSAGDVEKRNAMHSEGMQDHDVFGGNNVTKEDAMHMGALTEEEEAVLAKKLRTKIDLLIMPLVILVRERSGL